MKTQVPEDWYAELRAAAESLGISVAALLRLIVRDYLRNRYDDRTRADLQARRS